MTDLRALSRDDLEDWCAQLEALTGLDAAARLRVPARSLTAAQRRLLAAMLGAPAGAYLSTAQLLGACAGPGRNAPLENVVAVQVHHLRKHLARMGHGAPIETEHGTGYRIAPARLDELRAAFLPAE